MRLRPIAEADLPDYVEWLNDPEVTQFTQIEGPLTLEHEREWFARVTDPDASVRNWAIEAAGRHIGNCALMPDESGDMAGFGIIIGDKTQWSKGYGTAALREVLRIGFKEMGLQRIHLAALGGNTRGIRCYEKCGFRHEGVRRRHFLKRGKWEDIVCMGILREEWEAAQTEAAASAGEVTVRSYRPTDYDDAVALWREVGFHVDDRDSAEDIARYTVLNPGLFLMAEVSGSVVGTVLANWDGRRSIVYRMATDPSWRRRGIGARLMSEVERRLKVLGAKSVALLASRDDERAVGFYEALGYEISEGVTFMMKRLDAAKESGDGRGCD